ncbi:MAG TPA: hypothetical protein VFZ21_01340 [Gemmatimonadaceae bacterium]|nr:hypothetical protein [Gemmatimonadaceae bacterium]
MVDVAVREHDGDDGLGRAMLVIEFERGRRRLGRDQRIEHHDAVRALGERDVRQVECAHLVELRDHLIEPALHDQSGLAPQARIDRRRRVLVLVDEVEPRQIPHQIAVGIAHLAAVGKGCDQAARGLIKVSRVLERQRGRKGGVGVARRGGCVRPSDVVPSQAP